MVMLARPSATPFTKFEITMRDPSVRTNVPAFEAKLQAIQSPDYPAVFTQWRRDTVRFGERTAESRLTQAEAKVLYSGVDERGGYLAPPELSQTLLSELAETSWALAMATVLPANGDSLLVSKLTPNQHPSLSTTFNINVLGVTVATARQGNTLPGPPGANPRPLEWASDPHVEQVALPIRTFMAVTRVNRDWLMDADSTMWDQLTSAFARDMGAFVNSQVLTGSLNGVPQGFEGITGASSPVPEIQLGPIAPGMIGTWRTFRTSLRAQYQPRASVWMSGAVQGLLENLVAPAGVIPLTVRDYGQGRRFDGVPIVNTGYLADGTVPGAILVYGDLKTGYTIAQRAAISTKISTEGSGADMDQLDVVFKYRAGGAVSAANALLIGVSS
jgi:HK97 family phage major capsid protein